MWNALWNSIRNLFSSSTADTPKVTTELMTNEYKSVLYQLHRANDLDQLLKSRKRIRQFQQTLIEYDLHRWGAPYITGLIKLWNAKYGYWKRKVRTR
jgi:hypothetical protein